jgi:hypothetical protein
MEEQLLKIMIPEFAHLNMVQASKAAEKIASHVMEFIEWFDCVNNPFSKTIPVTNPVQYINFFKGSKIKYLLPEVYQYWLTNVKQ